MQRRYTLALATVVLLGLTALMAGIDAQAQIAFVSNRDGNSDIYVMDVHGGNPRQLTNDPATDRDPAWSPDGKRIAFESDREGNWDIYMMDADGNNLQLIVIQLGHLTANVLLSFLSRETMVKSA